jgi:SOUL heme-binding protein
MKNLKTFLISLILGLLSSGQVMAIEEPKYEVLLADGPYEIRQYAPTLIAETIVEGDMDEASNKGFRLIADFIFGNNQVAQSLNSEKIAMTAPVTVEPQSAKISMTAPVTVVPQVDGSNMQLAKQWRINFVMPNHYTLASIPKPKNSAVNLREVPSKHFAVLTYSGFNTLSRVQAKTQEAIEWALKKDLKIIGTPQLSRYDPPWTLPMFRRNEIMIEISDK